MPPKKGKKGKSGGAKKEKVKKEGEEEEKEVLPIALNMIGGSKDPAYLWVD